MRGRAFTETIRAHITPSLMRDLKQFAQEDGVSVSSYFRQLVADHLIANGWIPPAEDRTAIYRRRRLRVVKAGSVYLIKCGDAYKIGRTRDLARRLGQMSLPYKPRILLVVEYEDPGFVELSMHDMFAAKRLHGEWFALTQEEVMQAKQYMAEQQQ